MATGPAVEAIAVDFCLDTWKAFLIPEGSRVASLKISGQGWAQPGVGGLMGSKPQMGVR